VWTSKEATHQWAAETTLRVLESKLLQQHGRANVLRFQEREFGVEAEGEAPQKVIRATDLIEVKLRDPVEPNGLYFHEVLVYIELIVGADG
jgi:hypothetical protein